MASFENFDDSDLEDNMSVNSEDNLSVYSNVSLSVERTETYKVLSSEEVVDQMNIELKNISEALNIPPTITRIVMDHYNWQNQSLMDKFLASEHDRDAFFRDAGILIPRSHNEYKGHDKVGECLICFDTGQTTGLECGHKFCRDCWATYLTTKIVDYGEQKVPCPETNCKIIVEDVTVKSLVSNPDVLVKYNRLICNSFVKCKKNLYWCKSPGCNFVIDTYDSTSTFVVCNCGNEFCYECYEEVHAPISCSLLKKWKYDDSATESYISAHTKACPKCQVDIEKNGGCPHMTCRNCKHEFCWKCLNLWAKHGTTYQCNTPEEDMNIRKHRTKVERLKYCWTRYSYNRQALKDEMQRFDIVWEQFEHRFILKASLDHIFKCRRFLMYSYAFVYYLKESNQVYILETNLDNIEGRLDKASVALEDYIRTKENDEDGFSDKEAPIRMAVVDDTAHCDFLRKKWLDETEEGHANNTWVYREDY